MLKLEYDKETDALYLKFSDNQIIDSEEIAPDLICDYDEMNQVVGIEVLGLTHKNPEQFKALNIRFSDDELAIVKEFFVKGILV